MVRRIVSALAAIGVAVAVVLGGLVLFDRLQHDDVVGHAEPDLSTAIAEVRTLAVDYEATGSLVYEPSIAVTAPVAGTVTGLVDAGTTLAAGDVIAVVDDIPIVWLDGEIPAWRTMEVGDIGVDVAQLESSLDAMGFNGDGNVTVDDEYTAATAAMVESWQEAIGAPATGRIDLGTVVFGGGRSRVAGVAGAIGGSVGPGDELASLGTETRVATFGVAPADAVTLDRGDIVSVQLPDRSSVEARIDEVARAADTWTVTTGFGPVELPSLDVVEVTMEWARVAAADSLTIPSSALLRLDNGAYVVDVVASESLERRAVEIGTSVGTRVVVTAGLSPGDVVVTL